MVVRAKPSEPRGTAAAQAGEQRQRACAHEEAAPIEMDMHRGVPADRAAGAPGGVVNSTDTDQTPL